MKYLYFCETVLLISAVLGSNDTNSTKQLNISPKDLYKYGFKLKRAEQIEGVKRILKLDDYAKKHSMVKLLVDKLFKVLADAKFTISQSGYIPVDEFPDDKGLLDALGHVFENVAFFGDLLLRLPDITHQLYDKNKEWMVTMNWAVVFSNETGVFEDANAVLLDLMAQELEIIPRDHNYVNPYKEAFIKEQHKIKVRQQEERRNQQNANKRKKSIKRKRGPRLGGNSDEL